MTKLSNSSLRYPLLILVAAFGAYSIVATGGGGGKPAGSWSATNFDNTQFRSISFADAQKGWVVGSGGDIRHTSDGGQSWLKQLASVPVGNLRSVTFVDAQTGWAVGDFGKIIHTVDGGVTWGPQTSGTSFLLNQVFFLNANQGWTWSGGIVLTTQNGGASWSQQTVPGVNFFGVHFVDAQNGWAVGQSGKIFVTTNGGALWGPQISNTTTDLYSVYFLDVNNGFAAGGTGFTAGWQDGCTFPPMGGNLACPAASQVKPPSQILLRTTNQGQSWSTVFDKANAPPIHRIVFKGNMNGWLVSGTEYDVSRWASQQTVPVGEILATQDGGTTWTNQLGLATTPVYDISLVDTNNGFAVGADTGLRFKAPTQIAPQGKYTQDQPPRSIIWKTTNGGRP